MTAYDLNSLKFYANRPESKVMSSVACLCAARDIGEYCNILLCNYPNLKKFTCRNPEIDHIPDLLLCRLEELDVSGTAIAQLSPHKCTIRRVDASNTRIDPHELIKNWQYLEYCKTGFLEHSPHHAEFPRRVYENATEILTVRTFLLK